MEKYVNIKWQEGTIKEVGINGVQIENVLEITLNKLKELNEKFPCRENAITITKIEEAIMWQNARTKEREKRNVEGKMEA
ncbi:MAG: hypothetical protein GXZ08_02410 [Tissierellia bacterium]|nr:hypothetical protein [Tissierellia bacterium]